MLSVPELIDRVGQTALVGAQRVTRLLDARLLYAAANAQHAGTEHPRLVVLRVARSELDQLLDGRCVGTAVWSELYMAALHDSLRTLLTFLLLPPSVLLFAQRVRTVLD